MKSDLGILLVIFVSVKDLYDEIVEFHKDRHDRYYISSVSDESLDISDELTIPSTLLVEEFHFQWQQRARYIRIKAEPGHIVT